MIPSGARLLKGRQDDGQVSRMSLTQPTWNQPTKQLLLLCSKQTKTKAAEFTQNNSKFAQLLSYIMQPLRAYMYYDDDDDESHYMIKYCVPRQPLLLRQGNKRRADETGQSAAECA